MIVHVSLPQGVGSEGCPWRITTANQEFALCETYPRVLGVPSHCSDEEIRAVARFRSKGRLPVSELCVCVCVCVCGYGGRWWRKILQIGSNECVHTHVAARRVWGNLSFPVSDQSQVGAPLETFCPTKASLIPRCTASDQKLELGKA